MIKHLFGTTLSFLGKPAIIAISAIMNDISRSQYDNLWWSLPITIISLPLLPLSLQGDKMLKQAFDQSFVQRTQHLPKISLPTEYAYIEHHPTKGILVQPFHYDEEEEAFATEEEARSFLEALNYQEVLSMDCSQNQTFWVKNDKE